MCGGLPVEEHTNVATGVRLRAIVERAKTPRIVESVGFVPRDGAASHLFDSQAAGQPAIGRVTV